MNILHYAHSEGSWQPGMTPGPRDPILKNMVTRLCTEEFFAFHEKLTPEGIVKALIDREAQQSTATGHGIAFPHARLEHLTHAQFAIGTLSSPVQFDEYPVRIVCLFLVPTSDPALSLKLMAQLSRVLSEPEAREQVLAATTPDRLRHLFSRRDLQIDQPICARDIMHPPRWSVTEDTSISECSQRMAENGLRAIPVINLHQQVVGEITTDQLFSYGLPDFFSKLKSVSFIAEFDPFEKYFEDERDTPARALMRRNARTVPLDYTLMEIVFDLAIEKVSTLYVTNSDQQWVGTIDPATVLHNVINY